MTRVRRMLRQRGEQHLAALAEHAAKATAEAASAGKEPAHG
jgi:hypothetical protein